MALAFAQIAFTPSVRDQQQRLGSGNYANLLSPERTGGDTLGPAESAFIEERDGFYQATASETGWPYVQFRGGPAGFLRVLNDRTIAYADLRGNRQYISLGNLTANNRISLFLMDYAHARRLKIWGHVHVIERNTPAGQAMPPDLFPAKAERLIVIRVDAFDWNCPRHIPRRFTAGDAIWRIEQLEHQNAQYRAELSAMHARTAGTPQP